MRDRGGWQKPLLAKLWKVWPTGLDVDHVNCRLRNGILEIQVPISEASKPKQIQIQTGEERKAINA